MGVKYLRDGLVKTTQKLHTLRSMFHLQNGRKRFLFTLCLQRISSSSSNFVGSDVFFSDQLILEEMEG